MFWDQDLFLYSPQAISQKHHRSLLIQFLLFESIQAYKAAKLGNFEALFTQHARFFPYDWSQEVGHLNKIHAHSLLLKKSFPSHAKSVKNFETSILKVFDTLSKAKQKKKGLSSELCELQVQKLYHCLEPLIELCRDSENLIFFLLKNRQMIDEMKEKGYLRSFILKIHSSGLETLGEKMCDQYHQRGFFSQIPEFKLLLTELHHA